MTTLRELSEIKQRKLKEEYVGLIIIALFIVCCYTAGAFKDYYGVLISVVAWASIILGFSLWLGYFRTLLCPDCLGKLDYRRCFRYPSESLFYCDNCGIIDLSPQSSQEPKSAPSISSFENVNIISTCVVCNLPVFELEDQLACPVCFSLAHENHLLEWIKIKGCCPHCNTNLNQARVRTALNMESNLTVGSKI